MNKEENKLPGIVSPAEITPELFKEYVSYVDNLRQKQKRWFKMHDISALKESKEMETKLDKLNYTLLDETPKLF